MVVIKEEYRRKLRRIDREVIAGPRSATSSIQSELDFDLQTPGSHIWWREYLRGNGPASVGGDPVTVADFFCGSGGLSLGASVAIESLGLTPEFVVAADIDASALGVYAQNHRLAKTLATDVAEMVDYHVYGRGEEAELAYEPEILDASLNSLVGQLDLFLAGPPCQGHSNLNNHTRRGDPRNQLYVVTAALAIAMKSKIVVIENVPDVLSDKTDVVGTAQAILRRAGFEVSDGIVNNAEIGGAQSRRRHFTIATKSPHVAIDQSWLHFKEQPLSLQEVIGDLEDAHSKHFMDSEPALSEANRDRIKYLFDHDLYELPNEIRPDSHKEGHTYPSVYGRMRWDKPAQTVTTGFMSPGRGRYIHPTRQRVITAREAARIQGFPDWYNFSENGEVPSKKLLAKWIGDAVPTQLGYVAVLTALSGLPED